MAPSTTTGAQMMESVTSPSAAAATAGEAGSSSGAGAQHPDDSNPSRKYNMEPTSLRAMSRGAKAVSHIKTSIQKQSPQLITKESVGVGAFISLLRQSL
ncbi:MAG: hypothetical protein Q9215_003228 [Flavoplaca cf. flavocitrina]